MNKGTNFVPTLDNTKVKSVKDTITNEAYEALCTLIRKEKPSSSTLKVKTAKTKNRFKPYSTLHPTTLLKQQQNRPSFNVHLIDYVHNTVSSTKQFLHSTDVRTYVNVNHCNETYTKPPMSPNYVRAMILTVADKIMGWAFVPTHWFRTEYDRHFSDTDTYKRIDNFNLA